MVTILLLSILFSLSCSNDSDLLTDAVLLDSQVDESIIIDDFFVIPSDKSIVLNVLSNDGFDDNDNVQITEVSNPIYGSVEVNDDDMSIVYTPQSSSEETPAKEEISSSGESPETTDTFTYTIEVVDEDETSDTLVGRVEVVIEPSTENIEEEEDSSTSNSDEETQEDISEENAETHPANLLFSSGFEGVSLSDQDSDYRYIKGADSDTGFSWPPKILGSTGLEQEPSGIHTINDGGRSTITNRLETVIGHNGNETTALYQGINGTKGVTQTPYQINNIKENPDELYISYWMKIDDTSLSGAHKWRALWEYKTDNYGSGDGFRMIAFIYTDNNGKAYWNFQGDRNPSNPVWEKPNFDIPVPREEWFKVEYYFKWSEGSDGRAFMKVNGQMVGEHHGATTANSKNLDFIILTQVYGDTSPMHQWVDDIEIWDGLPY